MFEREIIREKFQLLHAGIVQASGQYDALRPISRDPQASEHVTQLRRDKRRHLRLVERLLEIVD